MSEVRFCSECKYAKVLEFEDGFKIVCQRLKMQNIKQKSYTQNFIFYKKLNQRACVSFEKLNS